MSSYVQHIMPLRKHKDLAYVAKAIARSMDLHAQGQVGEAQDVLHTLLACIDQVVWNNGSWHIGWVYVPVVEPVLSALQEVSYASSRPFAQLAPEEWYAAAVQYNTDLTKVFEVQSRPMPKMKGKQKKGDRPGKGGAGHDHSEE